MPRLFVSLHAKHYSQEFDTVGAAADAVHATAKKHGYSLINDGEDFDIPSWRIVRVSDDVIVGRAYVE